MEDFLIGGAVTLSVSLIGVVVGARAQARQEHKKWKRERKYEAYMLFFYEISRVLDFTRDVRTDGSTASINTREETEGLWRMSAGMNMHLPERLRSPFGQVNQFLGDLVAWTRDSQRDPAVYDQLVEDRMPEIDKLTEALIKDLKIYP